MLRKPTYRKISVGISTIKYERLKAKLLDNEKIKKDAVRFIIRVR